jgi:hypothetical protein
MVTSELKALKEALTFYLASNQQATLDDTLGAVAQILREFAEAGDVSLGKDANLTGTSLEIRTLLQLQSIGLPAKGGRSGLEDLIVTPPTGAKTLLPLVVEVKSDRKPYIQRDQLRQLDDWVFDLSQEEKARKHGLGSGRLDARSIARHGFVPQGPIFHPTPHKGVLVFNGPVGMPFIDRPQSALSSDELAFSIKRNFCIFSLARLLEAVVSVRDGGLSPVELWEKIQQTQGEFEL